MPPTPEEIKELWGAIQDIKREVEETNELLKEHLIESKFRKEREQELRDLVKKLAEVQLSHEQQISWVKEQRENKNKLWIGVATSGILAIAGWFMWLYSLIGGRKG